MCKKCCKNMDFRPIFVRNILFYEDSHPFLRMDWNFVKTER